MRIYSPISYNPFILSIDVQPAPGQAVLVVTNSPIMARAVSDFLRQLNGNLKPVWLTSLDKACQRLEWDQPKMVILDTANTCDTNEAADALHHISPKVEVLFLGGSTARH